VSGGEPVAEGRRARLLRWIQETKETLAAVVAIVVAVLALVHWGGDIVDWIRGKDESPTPPQQGTLDVGKEHIVTKPASAARFAVSGEAQGVDGKRCILRWQTYDGGNDQLLQGPGQRGEQAIDLDHHVCIPNLTFDVPAPADVDSLYAEVVLEDESGKRLAPPAKSETLILAHP
jgi:hypothetical protein